MPATLFLLAQRKSGKHSPWAEESSVLFSQRNKVGKSRPFSFMGDLPPVWVEANCQVCITADDGEDSDFCLTQTEAPQGDSTNLFSHYPESYKTESPTQIAVAGSPREFPAGQSGWSQGLLHWPQTDVLCLLGVITIAFLSPEGHGRLLLFLRIITKSILPLKLPPLL